MRVFLLRPRAWVAVIGALALHAGLGWLPAPLPDGPSGESRVIRVSLAGPPAAAPSPVRATTGALSATRAPGRQARASGNNQSSSSTAGRPPPPGGIAPVAMPSAASASLSAPAADPSVAAVLATTERPADALPPESDTRASSGAALPPEPPVTDPLPAAVPSLADVPSTAAVPPPSALDLRFDAFLDDAAGSTRIGSARLAMTATDDGHYEASLEARGALARLAWRSEGRLTSAGLVPERYVEIRALPFRSATERGVTFVDRVPGAGELAWSAGLQDRLSVLVQLSLLAGADAQRLQAGARFEFPLASVSRVDAAAFTVQALDRLDDEEGGHPAWRIERRKGPDAGGIAVWLAAEAPHLPVAVRYEEKGRVLRFVRVP